MVLTLGGRGNNIRSLGLISGFNLGCIGTQERLAHQLPMADFLEVATVDVQIRVEEFDLVYCLIKSLCILLGYITLEVLGLSYLGSKRLLELGYLSNMGLFLLLSWAFNRATLS